MEPPRTAKSIFQKSTRAGGAIGKGGEENQGKKDLILNCSDVCFYVKVLIYYDFDKDKLYIINNSVSIRFRHFKLNLFTCQPMFKKRFEFSGGRCVFFLRGQVAAFQFHRGMFHRRD